MQGDAIINIKEIRYFGRKALVYCDGRCSKAWGIQHRPRVNFDPADPDDYAFLADGELGEAPEDPGTYEGGDAKPSTPELNKWCVRECERSDRIDADSNERMVLPDFSKRRYNQPWKHKEA